MPISQVLILTETPFRKRDYIRFGVDILSRNYEVKVLDCTALLRPALWAKFGGERYECPVYHSVSSVDDIARVASALSGRSVAIDYLLPSGELHQRIRKMLRARDILRARVFAGVMPMPRLRSWKLQFREEIKGIRDKVLARYRQVRCACYPTMPLGQGMSDITVLSGFQTLRNPEAQTPYHIWAHSFDYDVYLSHREHVPSIASPYAVFLDQNLVDRHDFLITGTPAYVTGAKYYPAMNRFFDWFKRKTGLPVVIAGHPKSPYSSDHSPYQGKRFVLADSARLIQGATIVFGHYSTGLSFPVLWNKPVLFLTTDELMASRYQAYVDAYREGFGAAMLNVDDFHEMKLDWESWLNVSLPHYASFKARYIKLPGTKEAPLWEIFTEAVNGGQSLKTRSGTDDWFVKQTL